MHPTSYRVGKCSLRRIHYDIRWRHKYCSSTTYMCVCVSVCVCVCVCVCVLVLLCIQKELLAPLLFVSKCLYIYLSIYLSICWFIYTSTYLPTYVPTHTHTHTQFLYREVFKQDRGMHIWERQPNVEHVTSRKQSHLLISWIMAQDCRANIIDSIREIPDRSKVTNRTSIVTVANNYLHRKIMTMCYPDTAFRRHPLFPMAPKHWEQPLFVRIH